MYFVLKRRRNSRTQQSVVTVQSQDRSDQSQDRVNLNRTDVTSGSPSDNDTGAGHEGILAPPPYEAGAYQVSMSRK